MLSNSLVFSSAMPHLPLIPPSAVFILNVVVFVARVQFGSFKKIEL